MASTVLLVDDSEPIRTVLRLVFELAGFEVVGEAADGEEGVAQARALRPAAVVVDWQMPVMDGLHALPRLRAELPDAVIVMFSSRLGDESAARAMAAGADAYIEKGASPEEVVVRVRRLLDAREP